MSIASIFSSPKQSSFFSFLSSKEDSYSNRVNEVARKFFLVLCIANATILSMAALIYLIQGSVTFGGAVIASSMLTLTTDILARICVSWNLID